MLGQRHRLRGNDAKLGHRRESTAIPLIVCGPDVPAGEVCQTPVSLVDLYPTITSEAGLETHPADADLPGVSLVGLANAADDGARFVLSEFHAIGSDAAGYMIADARYKYHEYVGYPPEFFDLENDPGETANLAGMPDYAPLVQAYAAKLRSLLDPVRTDQAAKQDQARLVDAFGGREMALRTGTPGATPIPASFAR